jgi:RNA polymerase sigma factor (sigma-70 family)
MAAMDRPIRHALHHVRRLGATRPAEAPTDAQLLERFAARRDEAAFELLLRRHGPRVWGVCRRVLGPSADAEDAFQASFLLLVRRAGSVRRRSAVGDWLGRVAYRVAVRAQADARRRAGLERRAGGRPEAVGPDPPAEASRRELTPILAEEVRLLSEPYRSAVVLSYLEGRTNGEAARLLRWPVGTLKTRLARARELLGRRLARRGVTPVELPAGLVAVTVGVAKRYLEAPGQFAPVRALALTEGVVNAMNATKVKIAAAVVLAVALAGGGAGALSVRVQAGDQPTAAPPPADDLAAAKARLQEARQRVEQAAREVERLEAERRAAPARPEEPVAVIFGNVRLTRAEFGEFLIQRVGTDRLQQFVNKQIIEHACRERGVTVTPEELEAALRDDVKQLNVTEKEFTERVLRNYGKSLVEWKEDVLRPRLLLGKLARDRVRATDEELRREFANRYGERVQCRMILAGPDAARASQLYEQVRGSAEAFNRAAGEQWNPSLAASGGDIPPIDEFGEEAPGLTRAAFRLKPDQVTPPIKTPQGYVILKCVRRIPPDPAKRFEGERAELTRKVERRKAERTVSDLFKELREEAKPRLLLK